MNTPLGHPLPGSWVDGLSAASAAGAAHVLVTVLGCNGSTPRDQGSKMVVTADGVFDTIGGGQLEFAVISHANWLLSQAEPDEAGLENSGHGGYGKAPEADQGTQEIRHYPLAAGLAQCCGGSTTILFEHMAAASFRVAVYGAGHVARALVPVLANLQCKISWVDQRVDEFPSSMPAHVKKFHGDPVAHVAQLHRGSDIVILTHDHQLDFELCCAALNHGRLRHIGLIGSATKAARFRKRLEQRGYTHEQISTIVCPVGLSAIPGKLPGEIAVSIAGQLIAIEHQGRSTPQRRGLGWKAIKSVLAGEKSGYRLQLGPGKAAEGGAASSLPEDRQHDAE